MLRLDMHMIAGVLQYVAVASFAEAWIENCNVDVGTHQAPPSPPSRRRGLKNIPRIARVVTIRSPPSRRRGLKIKRIPYVLGCVVVASFAEAWIENPEAPQALQGSCRRLLRGGVD